MSSTETNDPASIGHEYDGIQEYDNPIPGWWKWILIGSIAFSGLYWFVSVLTSDISPVAEYAAAETRDAARHYSTYAKMSPDHDTLLALQSDKKALALGRSIYLSNCASCHGPRGEGMTTAPNLTDDAWIHVKRVEDIDKVITEGRNNNAMPAWGTRLKPEQILVAASYVASLRGTNAQGNPPQGTVIPAWDAVSGKPPASPGAASVAPAAASPR